MVFLYFLYVPASVCTAKERGQERLYPTYQNVKNGVKVKMAEDLTATLQKKREKKCACVSVCKRKKGRKTNSKRFHFLQRFSKHTHAHREREEPLFTLAERQRVEALDK